MGKSKLRRPKEVALGPQYRGSKVNRAALENGGDDEDEDENDPFGRGFEDEDSDEEDLVLNGDLDSEDEEEDGLEDGTDETDLSDERDQAEGIAGKMKDDGSTRREMESILAERQKPLAATLSQAATSDAEKGRAVKKQRLAFDSLLNTRMKLQKSLVATNTLVGTPHEQIVAERGEARQALEAAETAAFNLWNSLSAFRNDLDAARTGTKRKRAHHTIATPTSQLWTDFQSQEDASRLHRDTILKKWSAKTQGPTLQPQTSRLAQTAQATILDVLQEQLSQSDRLLTRAHAPRSCAPLQASQNKTQDDKIYDDADFYGLLLKELLESKAADSVQASNIDIGFQIRRENKTRRNVDTKASKGRKLRYTVHEKLQNFMAPEERGTWGERQSEELFGSLFGQRMGLAERDDDEEMADGGDDAIDPEEAAMLFGR